jgi:hypothetical protein
MSPGVAPAAPEAADAAAGELLLAGLFVVMEEDERGGGPGAALPPQEAIAGDAQADDAPSRCRRSVFSVSSSNDGFRRLRSRRRKYITFSVLWLKLNV